MEHGKPEILLFFFHFSSQAQKMPMVHTGFPIHHHSIVRLTPANPGLQKSGLLASTFGWLNHGMAHLKIYKLLAIRKAFVHESKAPNKVPKVGLGIFNENPCGLSYSSLPEYRHFCIPWRFSDTREGGRPWQTASHHPPPVRQRWSRFFESENKIKS